MAHLRKGETYADLLPVGAREGPEIAFDLAVVAGLGNEGAGAAAAVRALMINALGATLSADPRTAPVTVVMTIDDLAGLLDQQPLPTRMPTGLRVLDTMASARPATSPGSCS